MKSSRTFCHPQKKARPHSSHLIPPPCRSPTSPPPVSGVLPIPVIGNVAFCVHGSEHDDLGVPPHCPKPTAQTQHSWLQSWLCYALYHSQKRCHLSRGGSRVTREVAAAVSKGPGSWLLTSNPCKLQLGTPGRGHPPSGAVCGAGWDDLGDLGLRLALVLPQDP